METLSYLTDVIGPFIPGTPSMKKACEWAKSKFSEWGMANAAIEPCGEFGLGWANEYISVHMLEPAYAPLLASAKPWTLGTQGKIKGQPVLAIIGTKADLEKWKGKLKGAIVLTDPPRQVHPSFKPYARRYTNRDIYDHCVTEDLVQSAIVMASFVYFTAMRDEMLPRKPLPIPVEVK
jgi:hypothetical protein